MKHNSIFLFWVGQSELVAKGADAHKILNICMDNRIVYRDLNVDEEGQVRLWCSPYMAYILLRECAEKGVEIRYGRQTGLPYILKKHKRRIGLFLGGICAVIMILSSQNYIWDIRVSGNKTVTYSELVQILSECGLTVGSRIDELDVDRTESLTMLSCDRISWMSINIEGTYANIQIREEEKEPNDKESIKPSNLIAARDGQIEYLELFGGNPLVRIGDTVRKGDILVSGVWDSNHFGMFVTRSSGKVFARTVRTFEVKIPFEYEKKTLVERKTEKKYLIFFSKEIKVFENAGNMGASCDTIESVENLRFFNGDRLPVGIRTVSKLYYENETRRYTEEEAMNVAFYRLESLIAAELGDGEILRKNIECEITDDAYVLRCTVHCIEDIALMQEFDYVYPNGS